MLLVILGAGASYDSVPALRPQRVVLGPDSARPPLASELFADRERFATILEGFPACHPIVPILRHQSPDGLTVEQILEDLQNQAPKHPARTKQLAAIRFYLQAMIAKCHSACEESAKGITNYKVLLDQIERGRPGYSRVCLVTFN